MSIADYFTGTNQISENRTILGELTIAASQIVSLEAYRSGKSRLLADIEWAAQGDTPTQKTHLNYQ
ncbi:MAG: hypothetical protein ACLTE2_01765 [Eubacteriales bacterium]